MATESLKNYQSKPISVNWLNLSSEIIKGNYKIPKFQREYVWSLEDAAKLVDSVIKGYPIGTFIIWKTRDRFRSVKELGGQIFQEPPDGSEIFYILDGQQRITSLYCSLNGLVVGSKAEKQIPIDFSRLYVDIKENLSECIVKIKARDQQLKYHEIALSLLAEGGIEYSQLIRSASHEDFTIIDKIKQQIQTGYSYSIVYVENTPIDIATDMFTRINNSGKQLTIFEIMCAKTYIEKTENKEGFDLQDKFDELVIKLKHKEFETVASSAILQSISAIITGKVDSKSILGIERYQFRDTWETAENAIYKAVNFLKENLGVKASKILPYDSLIVPFVYYFSKENNHPIGNVKSYLETLFWHTSLSGAYSGSSNEEIHKDIDRVKVILDGRKPEFSYTKAQLINLDKVRKEGDFAPGKSFIKSLLCCYMLHGPINIFTGSQINLENEYLQRSNSKQFHHVFPKQFLIDKKIPTNYENNIANIIIIDAQSNQKIGKKDPADYFETCRNQIEQNSHDFELILKTNILPHYTDEWERYADFDRFVEWRQSRIVDLVRSTIKVLQ